MKSVKLLLVSLCLQSGLQIVGMDGHFVDPDAPSTSTAPTTSIVPPVIRPGEQLLNVPVHQQVRRSFESLENVTKTHRDFLTRPQLQKALIEQLKNPQSHVTLQTGQQVAIKDQIGQCCNRMVPILQHIKNGINELFSPEQLSNIQESEDRQGMRIGESFFESLITRLEKINERLVLPVVDNNDDQEIIRRRLKLRVAESLKDLLGVKRDLIKFFKLLDHQPLQLGQSEPVDKKAFTLYIAEKVDPQSISAFSGWVDGLVAMYNRLFTKEGETPLQVPDWIKTEREHNRQVIPEEGPVLIPEDSIQELAQEDRTENIIPQVNIPENHEQSSLLQQAVQLEELNGHRIIGSGGTVRQLNEFKQIYDGNGGVINNVLRGTASRVENVVNPAPESGFIKRFVLGLVRGIGNRIVSCARWVAYKTFLNKREFERKPLQERSMGQFWSRFVPGWPGYQAPQPQPQMPEQPRRWYHKLMFWR